MFQLKVLLYIALIIFSSGKDYIFFSNSYSLDIPHLLSCFRFLRRRQILIEFQCSTKLQVANKIFLFQFIHRFRNLCKLFVILLFKMQYVRLQVKVKPTDHRGIYIQNVPYPLFTSRIRSLKAPPPNQTSTFQKPIRVLIFKHRKQDTSIYIFLWKKTVKKVPPPHLCVSFPSLPEEGKIFS